MKTFTDFKSLPEWARRSVLAIGNFDGVHRGHQALLRQAREVAAKANRPFGVLTFEPHPRQVFRPDDPPSRLTPFPLKAQRLEAEGAELVFALPFDWDFASQSAENFIKNILKDGLGAEHVVVGADFRFGQMRKGKPADIVKAGIEVSEVTPVTEHEDVISSSLIREALRAGDLVKANALLGWEWEMWGAVIRGDQRGRALGYPTANFALAQTMHPAYGVYAALVQIKGEDIWRKAAVNVGIRPMFEIPEAQVESYIFDFNQEIYEQTLKVRPVKRIRSEARFDSMSELIAQIDKDCIQIKKILKHTSLRGTQ
ncbi:MAG: bifunctional riboflavin kinase/FAD synthetase [Alphaproteobacteria bacterium]